MGLIRQLCDCQKKWCILKKILNRIFLHILIKDERERTEYAIEIIVMTYDFLQDYNQEEKLEKSIIEKIKEFIVDPIICENQKEILQIQLKRIKAYCKRQLDCEEVCLNCGDKMIRIKLDLFNLINDIDNDDKIKLSSNIDLDDLLS